MTRELRIRLWAEHLGCARETIARREPHQVLDHDWQEAVNTMATCLHTAGVPPEGQIHRYNVSHGIKGRTLDYLQEVTLER